MSLLNNTVKISADILWPVFHTLTEPVPYTFVSVNRRNNKARAHMASLFHRFTDTNGSVKIWKTRRKVSGVTRIFCYSVLLALPTVCTRCAILAVQSPNSSELDW